MGGRHEQHHDRQDSRAHLLASQMMQPKIVLSHGFRGILGKDNSRHMTNLQREFFRLVEEEDTNGIVEFMSAHPQFDVNVVDKDGAPALVNAVNNEDEDTVHYLLQLPRMLGRNSALHAVNVGNESILKMLLDHQRRQGQGHAGTPAVDEGNEFTLSHMTPLMLAAHKEDRDMISLLLKQGHYIQKPHMMHCWCPEQCRDVKSRGERLEDSYARFDTYKALASPLFMCLTSQDPILTAFQLSHELGICVEKEREFKADYLPLYQKCSEFAVDLLDQCTTSHEVNMLFTRKQGYDPIRAGDVKYSRLFLAVEMEQKSFVAHRNSQQVLRAAWLDSWADWICLSFMSKMARLVPRLLMLPFMTIVYFFAPDASFTRSWRSPINKFFSYAASYILFLALLILHDRLMNESPRRGAPDTGMEPMLVLYILGLIWRDLKHYWKLGHTFLVQKWNRYNVVMNTVYIMTFVAWGFAEYDVSVHGGRDLDRTMWNQYDPTLVAEIFYIIAVIMSFGRVLYFFQINQQLGPLQVSLGHMLRDITYYLVFFAVLLVSCASGLHKIYHPYTGQVRKVNGEVKVQVDAFDSFQSALKTEFWALYGYSPPNYADLVIGEHIRHIGNQTVVVVNKHKLTESVGYLLFGLYNISAIIVLLNMLIAMMSTSFMNVQENSDVEWKFARTQIWLEYFDNLGTLPPPYNLVPSLKGIYWVLTKYCFGCCCKKPGSDLLKEKSTDKEYRVVMKRLVRRYMRRQDQMEEDAPATGNDLEDLKEDVDDLQEVASRLECAIIGDPNQISSAESDSDSD